MTDADTETVGLGSVTPASDLDEGERADCVPGLISVLVPVRDLRGTVERCIRSILAQTYENMEVIVVDDGSADGTGELLDALVAREPRMRALHQGRLGVSAARNAALRAARGEWVAFVDADDWVEPGHLEGLLSAARQAHAQLAYCGFTTHEDGHLTHCSVDTFETLNRAALLTMDEPGFCRVPWNKLYRRDLIYNDGPVLFDNDLSLGEDEAWLAEVLLRADFGVCAPQETYHWCRRGGSLSNSLNRANVESWIKAELRTFQKIPDDCPVAKGCVRMRLIGHLENFVVDGDLDFEEKVFCKKMLREQLRELRTCSMRDAFRKSKHRLAMLMITMGLPRGAVDAVRGLRWPFA